MLLKEWRTVELSPSYTVSNWGNVFSSRFNREIFGGISNSGYKQVTLHEPDGAVCSEYVHRLVANAFVVNLDNLDQVNHKDGNKLNNLATNLEWVDRSKNMFHAYDLGLKLTPIGVNRVPVRVIETGQIYESQLACARLLGINSSGISNVLLGKSKKYMGYTFERVE